MAFWRADSRPIMPENISLCPSVSTLNSSVRPVRLVDVVNSPRSSCAQSSAYRGSRATSIVLLVTLSWILGARRNSRSIHPCLCTDPCKLCQCRVGGNIQPAGALGREDTASVVSRPTDRVH